MFNPCSIRGFPNLDPFLIGGGLPKLPRFMAEPLSSWELSLQPGFRWRWASNLGFLELFHDPQRLVGGSPASVAEERSCDAADRLSNREEPIQLIITVPMAD